ncbi:hypothetical protein [Falsiroseomonas stagni]|uniref:Uncharacterized protein n=1 Tax=Falsiroseomonas stagni DSM 19981 TaxID=1123062 RepID=A0A1I3YBJ1_9PROT|nr:hypothetical protein [Falsiroseomonas stagni]SFK29337.1 hypothetical protein SAMN02745775_1011153 [Falsiroseomonas stagni DSM 19981]
MSLDAALIGNDFHRLKRTVLVLAIVNILTWILNVTIADGSTVLGVIRIDTSVRLADFLSAILIVSMIRLAFDWHSQPTELRKNSTEIVDFSLTLCFAILVVACYWPVRGFEFLMKSQKQATVKEFNEYVLIFIIGTAGFLAIAYSLISTCLRFTSGVHVIAQYVQEFREGPFETDPAKLERYLTVSEQKFVFFPDSPTQFKILRFGNSDSHLTRSLITKNGNENEFAWKIVGGRAGAGATLEIYARQDWNEIAGTNAGTPYSVFRFHRRRLMWVMDNNARVRKGPVLNQYMMPHEAEKQT